MVQLKFQMKLHMKFTAWILLFTTITKPITFTPKTSNHVTAEQTHSER